MPIRILYWNIENFALNKVANPNNRKRQRGASMTQGVASAARQAYILSHLTAIPAPPDIMVVVEVETGYDAPGRIVRGAGANGAAALLLAIRAATANANWMLVPPIQTGPNEGVGIFYDSTNLVFTGPYIWPGGAGGVAVAPGGVGAAAYAAPFNVSITTGRVVPGGAMHNVGTAENLCAARVDFTHAAALGPPLAGTPIAYAGRAPYMASFADITGGGGVVRNITLYAVHSPATVFAAGPYLAGLANTQEIVAANAATELKVVLGDFNVNLLTAAPGWVRSLPYGGLVGAGYGLALDPLAPAPGAPANGYEGYYATHIRRGKSAVYWSTAALNTYYPAYGYYGSEIVANFYAIDNIFTRYGAGIAPPGANNFTILNGIVGSQYNLFPPPAVGTPQGALAFPIAMAGGAFAAPPAIAPAFTAGRKKSFNGWANYGFIRSTSDHLALVMDV
ncbi:MAG: hypothetical protein JST22_10115 [Bacteroidetes bacterium]|nr:hypothetical protein [Bacteroidota bacterium]